MSTYKDPNFPGIFTELAKELRPLDRALLTALSDQSLNLQAILDKGISLDDNIDADVAEFTSNVVADTEDVIPHSLGKIPVHFIVSDIDKGGVVYRSGTAFTKDNIYLKTSVASAAIKVILL